MREEAVERYHFEDPGQGPFAVSRCSLLSFGRLGLLVTLEDNSKITSVGISKNGPSSTVSELWMTESKMLLSVKDAAADKPRRCW